MPTDSPSAVSAAVARSGHQRAPRPRDTGRRRGAAASARQPKGRQPTARPQGPRRRRAGAGPRRRSAPGSRALTRPTAASRPTARRLVRAARHRPPPPPRHPPVGAGRGRARPGRPPPGDRPQHSGPTRTLSSPSASRVSPAVTDGGRALRSLLLDRQFGIDEADERLDVGIDVVGRDRGEWIDRRPRRRRRRRERRRAGRSPRPIDRADRPDPTLGVALATSAIASSQRPARNRASSAAAWKCGPNRRSSPWVPGRLEAVRRRGERVIEPVHDDEVVREVGSWPR